MAADPYKYFRLEAREIVDQFGATILDLEKAGGPDQIQRLLRLAHTLKGAARVVKQREIADGAHAIEDILAPFRDGDGTVSREGLDGMLARLDMIGRGIDALGRSPETVTEQAEPAEPPARQAGNDPVRMVRAEIAEIDALLEGLGETHALLGGLRATLRAVQELQRLADLVAEQLAPRAASDRVYALADDLRLGVRNVERQLGPTIDQIDRELRQAREAAEQVRLVGVGTLFTGLERTARDTARALGKEVTFAARGGDLRLDADILATVQGALVQLVRNAAAHGIESPDIRRSAGKPPAGRIALDVFRRGGRIVFACEDDGGGIDVDAVRRAALGRGVAPSAVDRLDARELVRLLMRGGITTAATVTEIAGRGIGLDVVREAIDRLGGTVEVITEQGKGTRFELAVPSSLVAIDALMIEAAGRIMSVPLDAVRATVLIGANAISRGAGTATIVHDAQTIPFLWLPPAFGGGLLPGDRKWPTIIVSAPVGLAAVGFDRLLGTARVVVRPLPELAPTRAIVSGASLDAEGTPQLALSPDGLVVEAGRPDAAEAEPEPERRPVLIVDDSLTTRMLEQSILESAGYEVDLAVSAEDGLDIARRRRYSLFLVDVEMPGMSGFDFVERVRADPVLHDIPAVLVTSRAAPEDFVRGRNAGAQGYIVKGEFDQARLLAMIEPLVA